MYIPNAELFYKLHRLPDGRLVFVPIPGTEEAAVIATEEGIGMTAYLQARQRFHEEG